MTHDRGMTAILSKMLLDIFLLLSTKGDRCLGMTGSSCYIEHVGLNVNSQILRLVLETVRNGWCLVCGCLGLVWLLIAISSRNWKTRLGMNLWMITEAKCREAECVSFSLLASNYEIQWARYDLYLIEPARTQERKARKETDQEQICLW